MIDRTLVSLVIGTLVLVVAACGSPAPSDTLTPAALATPPAPATGSPAVSGASVVPVAASAIPSGTGTQGIRWARSGMGLEVGVLKVPLDPTGQDGTQITIPLARRAATDPAHRIGTLLFISGGPGEPGTDYVQAAADLGFPDGVQERFDLVSFDPRGTPSGTGVPRVDCSPDATFDSRVEALTPADPADLTVSDIQAWMPLARAACEAGNENLLTHLSSAATVMDVEEIREALGEDQLSVIGQSWGTLTAAMYADAFPDRVRALVLDAPLDPSIGHLAFIRDKANAAQGALNGFLEWCTDAPECKDWAAGNPRAALDALIAATVTTPDGIDAYTLSDGLFSGLQRHSRAEIAEALAAAANGDPATLRDWGSPDDLDGGAYLLSVLCPDLAAPSDPEAYAGLAESLRSSAPDYAFWAAQGSECVGWPQATARDIGPVDAAGAPAALVLAGTGDAATPHAWAQSLTGQLAKATLLARASADHGTLFRGDACIDGAVSAYLVGLELPAAGTVCK